MVALRGYNTATILVKNSPYTASELQDIREFAGERAFDFIYAPGILPDETNRYNILPESIYYQAFTALLGAQPRAAFYASYPFDVTPPTDDHPFFGHFFKWSQAGQILTDLGKTWQPFGGAGYFVDRSVASIGDSDGWKLNRLTGCGFKQGADSYTTVPCLPGLFRVNRFRFYVGRNPFDPAFYPVVGQSCVGHDGSPI